MIRFIGFCSLLASCVLMAGAAFADGTAPLEIATKPASPMVFSDAQGSMHPLNPQANKLTIVHFWATWCAPCIAELPGVDKAQAAYGDQNVRIVALSLDGNDGIPKVKQFFADYKIAHLTPYVDFGMASFKAARSNGLPLTLFIDSSGNEIARAEGPLDWKSKEVKEFIEKQAR